MFPFNQTFLEAADVQPAFINADANNDISGAWVNLKNYDRAYALLTKPAGTAGDNPKLLFEQAKDTAGTGAKALNVSKVWSKVGADITQVGQWTANQLAPPSNVVNTASINGASLAADTNQAALLVEVVAAALDVNNGFTCVRVKSDGTAIANALIVTGLYILTGGSYPRAIPNSPLL